jgi:hypothetical protein
MDYLTTGTDELRTMLGTKRETTDVMRELERRHRAAKATRKPRRTKPALDWRVMLGTEDVRR